MPEVVRGGLERALSGNVPVGYICPGYGHVDVVGVDVVAGGSVFKNDSSAVVYLTTNDKS